jgi:hypothetical protein
MRANIPKSLKRAFKLVLPHGGGFISRRFLLHKILTKDTVGASPSPTAHLFILMVVIIFFFDELRIQIVYFVFGTPLYEVGEGLAPPVCFFW